MSLAVAPEISVSRQGEYVIADAHARIGADSEGWQIALIGKNLTNRLHSDSVADGPSPGSGTETPFGTIAGQAGFGILPRTV